MSDRHEFDDEITVEFVILQQLLMIGQLSTRIYTSARSEWQVNALNYVAAVEALESLSQPYLSLVYLQNVSKLDKKYRDLMRQYQKDKIERNEAYLRKGQNYEMGLTLAYANSKMKHLQLELNNHGILRRRTAHAIDDGAGGGGEYADSSPGIPSD